MLTDSELDAMRPAAGRMVAAVDAGDMSAIERIYGELAGKYRVANPGHAVAVLLAVEAMQWRDRFAESVAEGTRYASAYMDEKRRVTELRDLLMKKTAASTAKNPNRKRAI